MAVEHPPYKPSQEAFNLASAVLKCAQKTSVEEAASELKRLFYSPEELQKRHQNHEKWQCYLNSLPMSVNSETPLLRHTPTCQNK